MHKKAFEALKVVMAFARTHGADEQGDDFQTVLDWMDEETRPKSYIEILEAHKRNAVRHGIY